MTVLESYDYVVGDGSVSLLIHEYGVSIRIENYIIFFAVTPRPSA